MTGIAKGERSDAGIGYARQEEEVGVTWELMGLAMRQVAVKWNTTDERRVLERVRERRAIWGAVGR
jgi:hypothetical protein